MGGLHLQNMLPRDRPVVVHVFRLETFQKSLDLELGARLDGDLQLQDELRLVPVHESRFPLQTRPWRKNLNFFKCAI